MLVQQHLHLGLQAAHAHLPVDIGYPGGARELKPSLTQPGFMGESLKLRRVREETHQRLVVGHCRQRAEIGQDQLKVGCGAAPQYRQATPGKMAIGAKIVDAKTGGNASTGQLIGRYFAYYVSILPLMLGIIWVGIDPKKQGFHDKLAGTMVVRSR